MCGRVHLLVDVQDAAVEADVEGPSRREGLIVVDHAVGLRRRPGRVAQDGVVDAKRLGKGPIGFRRVDAGRKVGDVERPNLIATLTE